ncbi:MFS transporter [Streptomyces microflavus]|uniref:MFS transporter n=1 Tax=Streptomyces microflavus TaxID=1919 RepID=UPI0036508969
MASKDRLRVAGAALAAAVVELDWLAVNVALPQIAHDLNESQTDLQWVVTAFVVAFSGVLPVAGWALDALGRRRMLLWAIGLFLGGSLVCALAMSSAWLITGRAVQGVAAAVAAPGALALMSEQMQGAKRDRAVIKVFAAAGVGIALGPLLGGLFVDTVGWRSVFFIAWPAALTAGWLIYRHSFDPGPTGDTPRLPLVGMLCVTTGVVLLTVTIDRGTSWGWTSPATLTSTAAALVLLGSFAVTERDERRSVLSRRVYRERKLLLLTAAGATSVVGFILLFTLTAMYLRNSVGLSGLMTGCVLLAFSVPYAIASYLAGRLRSGKEAYRPVTVALVSGAAGLAGLSMASFPALYLACLVVCGIGLGTTAALLTLLVQRHTRPGDSGKVTSTNLAMKYFVAAVANTVSATVLEGIHGTPHGAESDAGAIDILMRGTACVVLVGALLLLPEARRTGRVAAAAEKEQGRPP